MKKRLIPLAVLSLGLAVLLAGCGKDPYKLYNEGKYAEAYPLLVQKAMANETYARTQITEQVTRSGWNGGVMWSSNDSAQHLFAARSAQNYYFFAAESQRMLGNIAEAKLYYERCIKAGQIWQNTATPYPDLSRERLLGIANEEKRKVTSPQSPASPAPSNGVQGNESSVSEISPEKTDSF